MMRIPNKEPMAASGIVNIMIRGLSNDSKTDANIIKMRMTARANRNLNSLRSSASSSKIIATSSGISIAAMTSSIAKVTDLRLFHLEDITPHYARTLACWRKQFFKNIDRVKKLKYSEAFIRMWDFYFSYCEAGFAERYIGDVQMLLTKPMCRRESLVPDLAAR